MRNQSVVLPIVLGLLAAGCGDRVSFEGPDGGGGKGGSVDSGTGGAGARDSGTSTVGTGGARAGSGGSGGTGGVGGGTAGAGGGTAGAEAGTGGPMQDAGAADADAGPYVQTPITRPTASKIDLLFMIDNSSSMSQKHDILAKAVGTFVASLIDPGCVDPNTGRTVGTPVNGVCSVGVIPFEPVRDMHVGIISSSLGSHGAGPNVCDDAYDNMTMRSDPHNNDRAHLISRGPGGSQVPTYVNKGFLYYNPTISSGLPTAAALAAPFTSMVQGVGQHGCGYEASLESVYRFLVDPEPYDTIGIDKSVGGYGVAVLYDTDQTLLQQRKEFLRPDSLVSVAIVTDENDCSIIDGGQGFYALLPPIPNLGQTVLGRGTSKCLENPNDACCFNCGVTVPPAGCPSPGSDPECMKGPFTAVEDQANLRCFNQKKRYGVDFLYPAARYIEGFTSDTVPNRKGDRVPNPLFSDLTCTSGQNCPGSRTKDQVLVAGLVGVPWQDIAVDPSDLTKGYKTAKQIANEGIWSDIVGDPANPSGPVAPKDRHMIESITPRLGLLGPASAPNADSISGHEWDPSKDLGQPNADLQFACVFSLATPMACNGADCDCASPNVNDTKNPVCQDLQSGSYSSVQTRGRAYPGTRILQVLQGIGAQATLGSICPAQIADSSRGDFGYTPFADNMLVTIGQALKPQCLQPTLPIDPATSQVACSVIEVFDSSSCNCNADPGRQIAADSLLTSEMKARGSCRCEMLQMSGNANTLCRTSLNPPANSGNGWCYVDPGQTSDVASCEVVRSCPSDQKRLIHFMNTASTPRAGATTFLRCENQPIAPKPTICP